MLFGHFFCSGIFWSSHALIVMLMQLNLEGHEIHEVSLKKKDGQSLGISIVGCNSSTTDGKETTPRYLLRLAINQAALH